MSPRHSRVKLSVPSAIALSALRGSYRIRSAGHVETCSMEVAYIGGSRVATPAAVRFAATRSTTRRQDHLHLHPNSSTFRCCESHFNTRPKSGP